MKLVTKELEKIFAKNPIYSKDGQGMNAVAIAKYFLPVGSWTWYVTEAEKREDGDWEFFGLVINGQGEKEFGYFTLSQLAKLRVFGGMLGIERDMYFKPQSLSKLVDAA